MTPFSLPVGSLPSREPERPEDDDRLQSYASFVGLVADQLQALRARDMERFHELGTERRALESELQQNDLHDGEERRRSLLETIAEEFPELLNDGLVSLEERLEADQTVRDKWAQIDSEALRAARSVKIAGRRPGEYRKETAAEKKLDVRF